MPGSDAYGPAALPALLDSLAYLLDELDMLGRVLARVPEGVVDGRPLPDDLSVKELYGALARLDALYADAIEAAAAGSGAPFAPPPLPVLVPPGALDGLALPAVLAQVASARRALLGRVEALPAGAWASGEPDAPLALLADLLQHTTDIQRTAAHRLYDARLTERPRAPR